MVNFKEEVLEEDLSFLKSLDQDNIIISLVDNKATIKFNKNNVSSTEIIGKVMDKFNVLDFSIKETSIEDIVKKIYKNEV